MGYSSVRCTWILEAPGGSHGIQPCLAAPTVSTAEAAAHEVPGCLVPASLVLAASPVLAPALTWSSFLFLFSLLPADSLSDPRVPGHPTPLAFTDTMKLAGDVTLSLILGVMSEKEPHPVEWGPAGSGSS